MKICCYCHKTKTLDNFSKRKTSKDGFDSRCKQCASEYYKNNFIKIAAQKKEYDKKNHDKLAYKKELYTKTHKTAKQIYDVQYRKNNINRIKKYKKIWYAKNKDNNIIKIKRNLRRRIHHVLKGKTKSSATVELLGCSIEYFISYIEKQFQPGMFWSNYGSFGWHIDHIIECYKFDLSDPEQQKHCFNYSNQRPLWAKDNLTRTRS